MISVVLAEGWIRVHGRPEVKVGENGNLCFLRTNYCRFVSIRRDVDVCIAAVVCKTLVEVQTRRVGRYPIQ